MIPSTFSRAFHSTRRFATHITSVSSARISSISSSSFSPSSNLYLPSCSSVHSDLSMRFAGFSPTTIPTAATFSIRPVQSQSISSEVNFNFSGLIPVPPVGNGAGVAFSFFDMLQLYDKLAPDPTWRLPAHFQYPLVRCFTFFFLLSVSKTLYFHPLCTTKIQKKVFKASVCSIH